MDGRHHFRCQVPAEENMILPMSVRKSYKNHIIEVQPYELKSGGWRIDDLIIERHYGSQVLATQFFLNRTLPSEGRAIDVAIASGQHQIDVGYDPG
jgi:hypothetical protein